jgi:hypothetical protein
MHIDQTIIEIFAQVQHSSLFCQIVKYNQKEIITLELQWKQWKEGRNFGSKSYRAN